MAEEQFQSPGFTVGVAKLPGGARHGAEEARLVALGHGALFILFLISVVPLALRAEGFGLGATLSSLVLVLVLAVVVVKLFRSFIALTRRELSKD